MPPLNRKSVVIIIDAWSGGKYLIPAFQALGYFCIHIQSPFVPDIFAHDNELTIAQSDKNIVYDGNIKSLLEILSHYTVKVILAGSEGAVSLADQLNALLGLKFSNQTELSAERRNKFLMQEQLASKKIASIKQRLVSHREALQDWLMTHHHWPVVLKPVQSAGTDGVFICHTQQEAEDAFNDILSRRDLFGNTNEAVLCQEFLKGTEFVVNGIACQDHYFFTESWYSKKKYYKGFPVYETQYLYYKNDANFDVLAHYTKQVCHALGIRNGAFHAEIMLTESGPILIEIGARIAGGADPYIIEECLGHSQISKLTQAVLHPELFLEDSKKQRTYTDHKQAAYIFMISPFQGKVKKQPEVPFINVDGVISVNYHYQIGEIQQETRDLLSSPGVIIVIQENKQALDNTIAEIRRMEDHFYQTDLDIII